MLPERTLETVPTAPTEYSEALGITPKPEKRPDGAYARALAGIEPEQIKWLWQDRIPFGMLSMLAGDPGLGKSTLMVDIAAKVSRTGIDVLLLSAEDHAAVTIRPRADAAKADTERIHVVTMSRDGLDEGLRLPDDCDALDALVAEHSARLVIIDPLMGHMADGVDSHSDKSTRTALAPLHHMAERRGCAIVFLLHLNKAKGSDPTYRTGGSIAVPAAVRSALLLARDPDDPEGDRGSQRVLAQFKSNLGPLAESEAYEIEAVQLPEGIVAPRLKRIGTSNISGADLLSAPAGEERTERTDATEFLRIELADGAKPVRELMKLAPCGERTLRKAKKDLGVEQRKSGFNSGWEWFFPEGCTPEGCNPRTQPSAAFVDSALESQMSNGHAPKAATDGDGGSNGAAFATPEQEADVIRAARKFGESP